LIYTTSEKKIFFSKKKMWKVVTFNVLHITHEINHCLGKSPVLDTYNIGKFADLTSEISMLDAKEKEQNRLKDLFIMIRGMCDPQTIVCLQEVPGDLLHLLVSELVDFKVFSHTYSRVPTLKKNRRIVVDCKDIYNDPTESLVTIVPLDLLQDWHTITSVPCDSDLGKACLIVSFRIEYSEDITIANSHIPFQPIERHDFIRKLVQHLDSSNTFILTGDTNCHPTEFRKDLPYHVNWKLSTPLNATRRGIRKTMTLEESCIDYFIHYGIVSHVLAHSFSDISDHTPVSCHFDIV
jgi:endonuclease/exonuclease/phosphatase family metal-dependent hydrolase